jgi:hypothetical protein
VSVKLDLWPVVEPGATHGAVVESEARHADDVQRRARRRAEARDVAGVRRNLWLDECYSNHPKEVGQSALIVHPSTARFNSRSILLSDV